MRGKLLLSASVLLLFAICRATAQSDELKTSVLTVLITTPSGGKTSSGALSIRSTNGSTVFSTTTAEGATVRIPYGEYVITFGGEFLADIQRAVSVNRPDCFVVLAAEMSYIVLDLPHDPVSVSIKIESPSSCTPGGLLWARLIGVYSSHLVERRIASGGYALFEPLSPGTYAVLIVDGEQVRAFRTIRTWGPVTVVTIPLSSCGQPRDK